MFLVYKADRGWFGRFGLNYELTDGDLQIAFKIPLWFYFRKKYEDFETKCIMSGWTAYCSWWGIRRRNDYYYITATGHKGKRWLIDKPFFGPSLMGKQKVVVHRKDRETNEHGSVIEMVS